MATRRAGAAARQTRLLEQLQAAKESLRPPVGAADNDGISVPPKESNHRDSSHLGSNVAARLFWVVAIDQRIVGFGMAL